MITRQNYQCLAACLRHSRPVKLKGYKYDQWLLDREFIIQYLTKDNPRFDPCLFRMATEINKEYKTT